MPAGTIALTNGSATVTGSGTSFTSELKAGDFIYVMVGGAPYTLVASTVVSNTQITLAVAYDGPTSSGLAWVAAPALMQAAITQKILNDFATVGRGRILDFQNWQKIYSDAQSVTVTRPDRTTFTGPSWGYMANQYASKADLVSGVVALSQGGTGQKNASAAWKALLDGRSAESARNDLGLGSSALRDAFSGSGKMLSEGDAGLLTNSPALVEGSYNRYPSQIRRSGGGSGNVPYGSGIYFGYDNNICFHLHVEGSGNLRFRYLANGLISYDYTCYHTGNTTKSSDGTLKAASPVARIVQCKNVTERSDVDETGFVWCGCGTANAEAEGISIKRFDAGVYVLTGSAGLAKEGWQLLPPRDPQGSGDLGIVEAEETESGGLKISLYKRRYRFNADNGDIEVVKGDLIDVPVNSWIDVRLDMPEDSAFNLKQKAMQEAADSADTDAGS